METNKSANIGSEHEFELLWDLPGFPLTEKFGTFQGTDKYSFDQSLVMNRSTGHVQLLNQLSPAELYTEVNYNFRTSETGSSIRHLNDFCSFFESCIDENKTFRVMVDIGGNDRATVKKLQSRAETCAVVDPICKPIDNQIIDEVRVIGRLIEDVNLETELDKPDLVICRHTIEHVANPWTFLAQLFDQCDDDCTFLFEMPCFESLLGAMRLDAIFHQHVHYFDILSFRVLLDEIGGEYVTHGINHQGPCGGALYVCFKKKKTKVDHTNSINFSQKTDYILNKISCYTTFMRAQRNTLEDFGHKTYGYGAGLMLATLNYHLKYDLSKLPCILDDDPIKHNTGYQNINVAIKNTDQVALEPNNNYLITSLENIRPIYKKIIELQPKRVLIPAMVT